MFKNVNTLKIILLAIIILAAIVRIWYFVEIHNDILLRYVTKDSAFDEYRFINPVGQIIDGNWMGPKVDYTLGYSYLISFLYLFLPRDITTVFAFQIILGILAVYISYRAVALLFNNKVAGLIAAFVTAFYSPFVFQECDIERGAIMAYCNLFCFYFLLRGLKKDKIKYFFFAGLVLGLSMVIRPNIFPVLVIPYIFFMIKKSYRARIYSVAAFVVGMMILSAPLEFRNLAMGDGFTIEPHHGVEAFWVGNAHNSPGIDLVWLDSQKELAQESHNSVGKAFIILWREIKKYPEDYRHLYDRKIKMFFNAYEVPSNLNYYLFKEQYPVLGICFINFAIVAPLAIVGIFLARRKYPFIGLLYIFLFLSSFLNIAFHIQGRYRIPALPFFIMMASYTIYWIIDKTAKQEWTALKYTLAAIICIAFYTKADYVMIKKYSGGVIRSNDYGNLACAYLNKSNEIKVGDEQKNDDIKQGALYLEKAIKINPLNRSYYMVLAQAYYVLGEDEASKRVFNEGQKIMGPVL